MKNTVIKSTLSVLAVTVSIGVMATAKAEQVDETLVKGEALRTETVTFSRAELATEDGREAFEYRVRHAAEKVCGSVSYREVGSLAIYTRNKECYNQAIADALSQVDRNQVASTAR